MQLLEINHKQWDFYKLIVTSCSVLRCLRSLVSPSKSCQFSASIFFILMSCTMPSHHHNHSPASFWPVLGSSRPWKGRWSQTTTNQVDICFYIQLHYTVPEYIQWGRPQYVEASVKKLSQDRKALPNGFQPGFAQVAKSLELDFF